MFGADSIKVTTFNIRYASSGSGPTEWPNRKALLGDYIKNTDPDLLGLQEVLQEQINFLDSIAGYDYVGVGRDNGTSGGEYNPIFYKSEKFTLLESGTFWLSSTPNKPSKGWDAACNRICTWALFKRKNGERFYFFNTHLDHEGVKARLEASRIICARIALMDPLIPLILTGDMNTSIGSIPIDNFEFLLSNSEDIAIQKNKESSISFNGFNENSGLIGLPIDFIFVNKGFLVDSYYVNQIKPSGQFISDHYPVEVKLRFKE